MIGGLIMVVGIVTVIMIHEGGHLVAAKAFGMKATEYFLGFGPRLWSFRRGETEYGVKAIPLGGYVRIVGMNPYEEVHPADEARTYRGNPFWKKSVVVLAGIASHFVVAYLILFFVFAVLGVHDGPPTPVIRSVIPETEAGAPTPASQAGLQPGDRVVALDGRAVDSWEELTEAISARPGEQVMVVVERDGTLLEERVRLAELRDGSERVGFLGVRPVFEVTRMAPVPAAVESARAIGRITVLSASGLGSIFQPETLRQYLSALTTGAEVSPERRPVSPVGLVRVSAQMQEFGLESVLGLLAAFNVFVGLFNLVPLYPFDGGHFAVAAYEKITGREPDVRKLMPVAAAVIILIGFLFVTALYLDIFSPLQPLG